MSQPKIKKSQVVETGLYDTGTYGWNDLTATLASGKTVTATDPSWVAFRNGIYAYEFSASAMMEVWISFHVDHTYLPGSVMYPHVHWATAGTNTGVVRWGMEFSIARGYDRQAFPLSTTVYVEQAAHATAYMHQIAENTTTAIIPATDLEPDSLILMRVFRDAAHANDTCTDAAFGLMVDLHYQVSDLTTVNRNYPFS